MFDKIKNAISSITKTLTFDTTEQERAFNELVEGVNSSGGLPVMQDLMNFIKKFTENPDTAVPPQPLVEILDKNPDLKNKLQKILDEKRAHRKK